MACITGPTVRFFGWRPRAGNATETGDGHPGLRAVTDASPLGRGERVRPAARSDRPRYTDDVRVPLAPALILALVLGCTSRQIVSGRDLIEAPDRFAGHRIVLTGVVQDPRRPAPAGDGGYTTFTLLDGGARIPVAAPGTQSVSAGDLVEVRGVFREQARVGGELLLDTVEAELVRPLRTAAQPPGTPVGPP